MFEPFSYLERLVGLRKSVMESDISDYQEEYRALPHFVSASLSHLLPEIPKGEHLNITKEIYFYQQWSGLDEQSYFLKDNIEIIDEENVLNKVGTGKPYIFCTFHVGSYRMLNLLLMSKGVKFALIVDEKTLVEQGEKFEGVLRGARAAYQSDAEMTILKAEDRNIALRAIRTLKSGKSLVVYLDGNTGVGGVTRQDDKMVKVRLLTRELYARKGIAFLSHVSRTPLVPVICERTGWLSMRLTCYPAILPSRDINREEFCQNTTQKLYSLLETYLKRVPEQWEGWFYLHKFLNTEALSADEDRAPSAPLAGTELLKFNDDRYGILRYPKANVLFDSLTYRCYPLSRTMEEVLSLFREPHKIPSHSPDTETRRYSALSELISRKILLRYDS